MQIITICSIWQQPSLLRTTQPVLSPFPCTTNIIVQDDSDLNKLWKKEKNPAFYIHFWNPESFETER